MKHLSIVRHGKAVSPEGYERDFDRPLQARGQKETLRIAKFLARSEPPPDLIATSPAQRALETAALLHAELGLARPLLHVDAVYEATGQALLDALARLPDSREHAVLVGHNPGLEELLAGLVCSSANALHVRLPTAALAGVELESFRWSQVRWGCGTLRLLLPPKALRG